MSAEKAFAAAAYASMEKTKGDIVTKTLDTMNNYSAKGKKKRSSATGMQQTYEFSKDVLGAYYEGKGTIINSSK